MTGLCPDGPSSYNINSPAVMARCRDWRDERRRSYFIVDSCQRSGSLGSWLTVCRGNSVCCRSVVPWYSQSFAGNSSELWLRCAVIWATDDWATNVVGGGRLVLDLEIVIFAPPTRPQLTIARLVCCPLGVSPRWLATLNTQHDYDWRFTMSENLTTPIWSHIFCSLMKVADRRCPVHYCLLSPVLSIVWHLLRPNVI